jgi:membrane protein DedA with SNARE-associated domain
LSIRLEWQLRRHSHPVSDRPIDFCMIFAAEMFEGLIRDYGYIGIIIYMILTGCGLPMPEEVAIIAGGALAASGTLNPWVTLGALLIGALLGDCVMYFIGYRFGRRILKANRFCAAYLTPEREQKVEALLVRHGAYLLFFARFLVGIRGPIYITAGILKMPFRKFLLADLVCATVVVSLFFGATLFFGKQIMHVIREGEGVLTLIVIGAVILGGGGLLWYQLHRRKLPGMEVLADAQVVASSDDLPKLDLSATNDSADSGAAAEQPPATTSLEGNGQPHAQIGEGEQNRPDEKEVVQ